MPSDPAEQRAAARTFHEMGSALVTLGRQLNIGNELASLGRQLRRVSPSEIRDDRLLALRRPIDGLRAFADRLTGIAAALRAITDEITKLTGIDN